MLKRYLVPMTFALLLTVGVSTSYAYPYVPDGEKIELYTKWVTQFDGSWGCDIYAGYGKLQNCSKENNSNTIWQYGCAITSLTMLYEYYGMKFMPDPDNNFFPKKSAWSGTWLDFEKINPGKIDDWLVKYNGYTGIPLSVLNLDWDTAVKSFYYYGWPWSEYYSYLQRNYYCSGYPWPHELSKNLACYKADWTDPNRQDELPTAQELLDYDLTHNQPDIMKISRRKSNGRIGEHFVLVAGYNPAYASYSVYDPGKSYGGGNYYIPRPLADLYGSDYSLLRLYRFVGWDSKTSPKISEIRIRAHSPVEMEIIDPMNRKTGYDPDTGTKLQENPMSLYSTEEPPSSLDGDDVPSEPVKILTIVAPPAGNYILRIIGTGDGPYTIEMQGMKEDGTVNLDTSLTGTATPSLSETYRVTYSPTGEASLSQTNQAPIANAGTNQTGEQSYEIILDGSASSDPDGDPLKYAWSFASKPEGSTATLSNVSAVNPTFTPDKPGTYTLQLVVNDYFTDSTPSTVTITATPVQSRISVTPNFSTPLTSGSGIISFDVNNTGRIGVSSGIIDISLKDPDGTVISTGSQTFSIGVGQTTTVSVPVTIPSLKFGNYTLTYTQSDETRTGTPTVVTISNSVLAAFSFDKITYRVRETANLTLNITNTGKFNLENVSITLSVPDAGYASTQSTNLVRGQTVALQFPIPIPTTITPGEHTVNVAITTPVGSTMAQNTWLAVQQSVLVLDLAGPAPYTAGSTITLTVENQGSVDTTYTTQKLTLTDNKGNVIYQGNVADTITAGEKKTLVTIPIPNQAADGGALLAVTIQDSKNGGLSYLNKSLAINGLQPGLLVRTDKDVYMNTEAVTALSTLSGGAFNIDNATLGIKVSRYQMSSGGEFTQFIPRGLYPLSSPYGVAVGPDGSVYVVDHGYSRVLKYDGSGSFIAKWGSVGSSNGQFRQPNGIAVAPDGSVYVADTWNHRIQKFDGTGNFIRSWGGEGTGNGQFYGPYGVAAAPDGSVYVADTYNSRIQKFDSNGNFITAWGNYCRSDSNWDGIPEQSCDGQFNYPDGIAVGLDGSVYVADTNNNRIQKLDSNGNFITGWGGYGSGNGQFYYPQGIAVGPDGSVYVAESVNCRIQKFDSNGNFITTWGSRGYTGNGQFYYPYGIAVAPDGSVYVADTDNSRIQKFDSNGNFITKWGSSSISGSANGQFYSPYGVAVAPDGSIYVADESNHRIQKFDSNANFIMKWGSGGSGNGQFSAPYGVAVSTDGSVYVVDYGNHRIQKFGSDGNFITKWGSRGSGNGQFYYPQGIAVSPDGSIYVADSYNHRIQKFDSNGNFIAKWGSCCSGNGQFNTPAGVAVGPDGSVYVADTYNYRIQKFDSSGSFIISWGGRGQFYNLGGISVGPDGAVYVADYLNHHIQQFDGNGNFSTMWGIYGGGDGQFGYPYGIAVGADGSVYVADSGNSRVQRMIPYSSGGYDTIFETNIPIAQPANTSLDYVTDIGALNTSGKLYLQAVLKNSLGQTIANAEYPFYIIEGNTVLLFSTDRKMYKPGETATVTGEVRNLSAIEAVDLSLRIQGQGADGQEQTIYTETFSVPAGGSHPFTATTTAGSEGVVLLMGTVSQSNTKLVEIIDQYEVASPKVTASVTTPGVAGNEPFTIGVEMKNEGKVDASIQYTAGSSQRNTIDNQTITIPAGETRLVQSIGQIIATTTYTFTFTGDLSQTVTKTVGYGLAAQISIGSGGTGQGSSVYPEGRVTLPVTITNTGQLGETLTVTYELGQGSGGQSHETRSYYLPAGAILTDTLSYDLTAGNYQVSALSSQPGASAQASLSVLKENLVAMTTVAGSQGANGLIPVTMTLTNSGYNEINGAVQLAVVNNDGKNVWRGEAQVSGLRSQASTSISINVDPAGLAYGLYPITTALYSTSGLQLAANQARIRTEGPIFEITALPNNPAFTVGRDASLAFTIKNSGTQQGEMSFTAKAMDILNSSVREVLDPGQEKTYAFTFAVPEDAEEKGYSADYALTSTLSQGTKGAAPFHVSQVKVGVTASIDKEAYRNGETAVLTMTVTRQSSTEDGTYVAIIRYGAYHDMQSFTLSSQPTTLTFNVPLETITGENLFYGIHFQSGTAIYRSSLFINAAQADLAADLSALTTGITVQKDNTVNLAASIMNYGKGPTTATTVSLFDGDPSTGSGQALIETKTVSALNPQGTDTVTVPWNVLGKAGEHTITAVVDPQDTVIEYSEQNNTTYTKVQVPDLAVFTETDRDTYKIRQKVYITSTLTNLTAAKTYSNLLLLTSAKDISGQEVYAKSISLGSLGPLNSTTSSEAWSTAGLTIDGSYTITQRVFAGSNQVAQSTKQVALERAPDFTVSTDVSSRRIKQGERATYTASLEPFNGWNHEVTFSMDGLPSGASISFNPDRLVPPAQAQAEVATTDMTPAGTHTLYLSAQGTDEGEIVTHTVQLALDIAGFGLDTVTPSLTIKQLERAVFPITLTSLNGYEGSISLSVTGLPHGVRASIDNPQLTAPGAANLTIQTSKYARPGTYTLTVAGNDGLAGHTLNLTLVLQPNPDIAMGIIATPGPGPQNEAIVRVYNVNLQLVREFTAFATKYGANAVTADIDGDGYDEIIVAPGPDPKAKGIMKVFRRTGEFLFEQKIFDTKYGLTLASADFDGDWKDEIVVGAGHGPKNPSRVKILHYDGTRFVDTGIDVRAFGRREKEEKEDHGEDEEQTYGVNVAAGDVDGDDVPELITAPGPESPSMVKVFTIDASAGIGNWNVSGTYSDFTAFTEHEARGRDDRESEDEPADYGATLAAGDIDADGVAEIIVGAGPDPKNKPFYKVFRGDGTFTGMEVNAYPDVKKHHEKDSKEDDGGADEKSKYRYGVNVAAGDMDGDGKAEIITGPGPGPQNEPLVKVFKADGTETGNFLAYPEAQGYGVKVSAGRTGR